MKRGWEPRFEMAILVPKRINFSWQASFSKVFHLTKDLSVISSEIYLLGKICQAWYPRSSLTQNCLCLHDAAQLQTELQSLNYCHSEVPRNVAGKHLDRETQGGQDQEHRALSKLTPCVLSSSLLFYEKSDRSPYKGTHTQTALLDDPPIYDFL